MGTRIFLFVTGFLMLTFGVLLAAWATQTIWNFGWRMQPDTTVRTMARATDFQSMTNERSRQETFQLRYEFKVPGDDERYVFDDDIWFIEQGDGWVDVPEDAWESSRDSGEVEVEYLEDDPSVNQPVEASRGIGSAILFGVLGLLSAAIGALLVFARARRTPPAPGELPSPVQEPV